MSEAPELRTERLLLRQWSIAHRDPFARLNRDPVVMEHFPGVITAEESDATVDRIERHFTEHGFVLWALEIPGVVPFAGYVGLAVPRFDAPFTPCVEIGWRLVREHSGSGYAAEAARKVLQFAFHTLGLKQVVSFTVPGNSRTRGVMERIGMIREPADDFDHPNLPAGHRSGGKFSPE